MRWVSRSAWGARAPQGPYNALSSKPKGSAIHWEGPHMGTRPHSECDDLVRSIQAYHMDTQGWSDVAYNLMGCPHGYVFEGRGKGHGSAANGTTQANYDWYAICALVGEGDPQPPELIQALQDAAAQCRAWGAGGGSVGHRDLFATECPGDALYSQVRAGTFTQDGDDDMPLTDDDVRRIWNATTTDPVTGEATTMGTMLRWAYGEAAQVWTRRTATVDGREVDTLTLLRWAYDEAAKTWAQQTTNPVDGTPIDTLTLLRWAYGEAHKAAGQEKEPGR